MSNTILGQNIIKLRNSGKTYKQITEELKCSKATVSYYCGENQKIKTKNRTQKTLKKMSVEEYIVYKKLQGYLYDYGHYIKNRNKERPKLSKELFNEVFKKVSENPKCYLTGKNINLSDMSSWSFDHIIPLSKGGNKFIENLGLTTKKANESKNSMTPEEFICFCKEVLINYGYKINK